MKITQIFLDMDGVIDDFVGGATAAHKLPNPYDGTVRSNGVWNTAELWGIDDEMFWEPLNNFAFWAGLKFTAEGPRIVKMVEEKVGRQNICLLTSPSDAPESAYGKLYWIKEHLPEYSCQYLMGSMKHLLAGPGRLLIDDNDKNCYNFREYGGAAILVPRPWNQGHSEPSCLPYIREQLNFYS